MAWKWRNAIDLWRFFTKFVGSGWIRPPSDFPEKVTKANLRDHFLRVFMDGCGDVISVRNREKRQLSTLSTGFSTPLRSPFVEQITVDKR